MNEQPSHNQTELGFSPPEVEPVTSEGNSGSIEASKKPVEGGSDMADGKTSNAEKSPGHALAERMARLLGATDPESVAERQRLQAELDRFQANEGEQANFMAVDQQKPETQDREPTVYWDPEIAREQRAARKAKRGKT
jgi:hypothetical protein